MIGLALVQTLKNAGCDKLIVIDVAADRLALAAKIGATHTVNSGTENAREVVRQLTHGRGADATFEAVGLPVTVDFALSCVRKGGSVVLVGNISPKIEFPLQVAVTRELSIYGSCASYGEYPACLDMIARGALDPAPLISVTAALADGQLWFDRLYRKEPGLLKVVLKP